MRRTSLLLLSALTVGACNTDTFVDDAGSDAPSDVTVGGGDGSIPPDAAKDVVVKPSHYCETVDAQFCADFDIPNDAGAGFAPPNVQGGWNLTFQSAHTSNNTPEAVEVDTLGDASGVATIENPFLANGDLDAGPRTHMVVDLDVYLGTPPLTPDPIFVFSAGVIPAAQLKFGLAAQASMWKLAVGTNGSPVKLNPQPPTNQWVHATLNIDISSSTGNVTLDIGSAHAQLTGVTGIDGGTSYPGYVGVGGSDPFASTSNMTYYVDNVVVRWQ